MRSALVLVTLTAVTEIVDCDARALPISTFLPAFMAKLLTTAASTVGLAVFTAVIVLTAVVLNVAGAVKVTILKPMACKLTRGSSMA